MHIYQPNYSWKLLLDYKKKYQQDRKELILIRRSFASFVVVKRQEDGRKNPFVAHFKPAKKNLSSHFEWMDTSTRPSLREEMRNKERKMEFTTLHLLARK